MTDVLEASRATPITTRHAAEDLVRQGRADADLPAVAGDVGLRVRLRVEEGRVPSGRRRSGASERREICAEYEAERLELVDTSQGYIAEPTHEQMLQRADVVDRATDILEAELAEVTAVRPPTERDRTLVDEYRELLPRSSSPTGARYTARLRQFELQPYGETLVDGGPVTNLLTDFAVVNEIPACAPPERARRRRSD